MIARKLVDNSLKKDYKVDTKCGIQIFLKKSFKFSQIKEKLFFARFSFSEVDIQNWRTDFFI